MRKQLLTLAVLASMTLTSAAQGLVSGLQISISFVTLVWGRGQETYGEINVVITVPSIHESFQSGCSFRRFMASLSPSNAFALE